MKKYLAALMAKELIGEDGTPILKCKDKNFFTLPNEVFLLQLPPSVFMVYAYLPLIEDRRTHTCHPSYNTIAAATEISKNTAMKSIGTLLEMGLITVESSSYFDKHGMKWKGNNLYTILPVRSAADAFYQWQLHQLELDAERRHVLRQQVEYGRRHPRAALRKIESLYKKDDCQSRNEFVVKAVNFYADYLAGQVNGVLPVAIQSAIDGRLGMFEDRLAQLLYKLAVETDMGISAVLDCIQLDADYLRRLRENSVKSVKSTNGLLAFEQKVRVLESGVNGDNQWQG